MQEDPGSLMKYLPWAVKGLKNMQMECDRSLYSERLCPSGSQYFCMQHAGESEDVVCCCGFVISRVEVRVHK